MKDRAAGLVSQLHEKELDAMLISAPENRRYLSGFTGSAGYLLLSKGESVLITDSRYTEQATAQAPGFRVIQSRGGWDWLVELLKETDIKRVGFESQNMTVATYDGPIMFGLIALGALLAVAQSSVFAPLIYALF